MVYYRRRRWHPTPVLLPGNSHGRRSLVGCRLWGRTGWDTTEVTWQQQQQWCTTISGTSLPAQTVERLPTMRETRVPSLDREDPLEKEMATHCSPLAWKIPWIFWSLVGYSPWGRKEMDMTERVISRVLFCHHPL